MQRIDRKVKLAVKDNAAQEEDRAERLILRRGGHVFLHSQMGEECLDFGAPQFLGMALAAEQDEAPDLLHVGLLRAASKMLEPDGITHLVQEFFRGRLHEATTPFHLTACAAWIHTACEEWVRQYGLSW